MKDKIPRWLYHHCEMCYEKGGCCGRQALIFDKEYTMEICFPDKWTWHMTISIYNRVLSAIEKIF